MTDVRNPVESFRWFCECLNHFGAEYVIGGSEAVAFHGAPRYSADFGAFVRATHANLLRVCAALERFGLADQAATIDAELWARTGATLRLGGPPDQIDVLLQLSGVSFDAVAAGSVPHTYRGVPVRIIGLPELLANKRAAGRQKDLADVEMLERGRE